LILLYPRKFFVSPALRLFCPWVTVPLGRTSVEIIPSDLFERGCIKDSVLAMRRPRTQQHSFHCSNFRLVSKDSGYLRWISAGWHKRVRCSPIRYRMWKALQSRSQDLKSCVNDTSMLFCRRWCFSQATKRQPGRRQVTFTGAAPFCEASALLPQPKAKCKLTE